MTMKPMGIEGVSARYAAQIQELLYTQAVRRAAAQIAAEREAARVAREAQAEIRTEAARKTETRTVEAPKPTQATEPARSERAPGERTSGAFLDTTV